MVGANLWGFGSDRDMGRGLAWIAVLMLVFEEVEGIARLKAFLIATVINVTFSVLQIWLLAARRHG